MRIQVTPVQNQKDRNSFVDFILSFGFLYFVFLFIFIICLFAVCAIWISTGLIAMEELSSQTAESTMAMLVSNVDPLISRTEILLKSAMATLKLGKLDTEDYKEEVLPFVKTLCKQIRNTFALWENMITLLYVGRKNGDIGGVARIQLEGDTEKNLYEFHRWESISGDNIRYHKIVDVESLNESTVPSYDEPFDNPTSKIWYITANTTKDNQVGWTKTYLDPQFPGYIFITGVIPYYDSDSMEAYIGVDHPLETLDTAIKSIANSKSAHFAIESGTNYLVAVSHGDVHTKDLKRLTPKDSDNYLIQRAAEQMYYTYGKNLEKFTSNGTETLSFYDVGVSATIKVSLKRYSVGADVDWVFVSVFNVNAYHYDIIIGIVIASVVSAVLGISFLVSGICMNIMSAKAMKKITYYLQKIEDMDLDFTFDKPSFITELRSIQRATIVTRDKLLEYRSFLPRHILEKSDSQIFDTRSHSKSSTSMKGSMKKYSTTISFQSNSSVDAKFNVGLRLVNATIMKIDIISDMQADEELFIEKFSAILEKVSNAVQNAGGILATFDYNSIICTWNTSKAAMNHTKRACVCASVIDREMKKLSEKWKNDHLPVHVQICIGTGDVKAGNIGCKRIKQFTFFGEVKHLVESMSQINKDYGASIVISQETKDKVETQFLTRMIVNVRIPQFGKSFTLYQLGDQIDNKADEWMYELEYQNQMKVWNTYNEACDLLQKNNVLEAQLLFMEFQKSHQDDKIVKKMIEFCEKKKQSPDFEILFEYNFN